jgi:hypothetical protein
MSTKTRQRPRLEVVPAQRVPGPCCAAAEQIDGALLHFEIGLRTHSAGLPVDWGHVAVRMAQTLLEAVPDEARP